MQHHDYSMINVPVAVFFGSISWWISLLNNYGWFVTHFIVPTLSAAVLACQLWIFWKRYIRRK